MVASNSNPSNGPVGAPSGHQYCVLVARCPWCQNTMYSDDLSCNYFPSAVQCCQKSSTELERALNLPSSAPNRQVGSDSVTAVGLGMGRRRPGYRVVTRAGRSCSRGHCLPTLAWSMPDYHSQCTRWTVEAARGWLAAVSWPLPVPANQPTPAIAGMLDRQGRKAG